MNMSAEQMGSVQETSLPDADPAVFEVLGLLGLAAEDESRLPADRLILTLTTTQGSDQAPTVSSIAVDSCVDEGLC